MTFKDFDELGEYIKERAIEKTKFKMKIARLRNIDDEAKESLTELFKTSLKEVKHEILEEINSGEIVVLKHDISKTHTHRRIHGN